MSSEGKRYLKGFSSEGEQEHRVTIVAVMNLDETWRVQE
jgi:hypothetical protein